MPATPVELDLTKVDYQKDPQPIRPRIFKKQVLNTSRKQQRARARRAAARGIGDVEQLYKPIEEWDQEELARGRPRDKSGGFRGAPPAFITRELHEEAMSRFRQFVRDGMQGATIIGVETIEKILKDDERDDNGKPIVTAATKLEAAKYLVDHLLGKPKQRVETDISVKLQALMATVMVTPDTLPAQMGSMDQASPRALEQFIEEAEWSDEDD